MTIASRTGFMKLDDFEVLWDRFVAGVKAADPQAFYATMGQERLDAPLDELKDRLREVSVQRKLRP